MKHIQQELLEATEAERAAATKRVKKLLSKVRSSVAGFGGATTIKKGFTSKGKKDTTTSSTTKIPTRLVDKDGYTAILQEQGVVRINNVLSKETAQALFSYISHEKITSEQAVANGYINVRSRFSDALLKKNRCDLLLPLEESSVVMRGLYETLRQNTGISNVLEANFGLDAELYELAALISDPGSNRQVIHPDVPFQEHMPLLSCFISLQDIDPDMGGTVFLPQTNTPQHHEMLNDRSLRDGLLQSTPNKLSTLNIGDCSIYDQRLLHAGGANASDKRRIIFYFTFRNPAVADPRRINNPGSIRGELKERKITLGQIRELVSGWATREGIVQP